MANAAYLPVKVGADIAADKAVRFKNNTTGDITPQVIRDWIAAFIESLADAVKQLQDFLKVFQTGASIGNADQSMVNATVLNLATLQALSTQGSTTAKIVNQILAALRQAGIIAT